MPKWIATVFLTPACNIACPFCASESGFQVMPEETARTLLKRLANGSTTNVVLGGGEPFLWPHDVVELARFARGQGLFVQVATNGIARRALAELDAFDRVILPIEAMDAAVHDALRPLAGGSHHALVIKQIEKLAAAGRELTISTVVSRRNVGELPRIADYLAALAASGALLHSWHLYRFLPVGRGGRPHAERFLIDAMAYGAAVDEIRRRDLPFRVFRRTNMQASKSVEFHWYEDGSLHSSSSDD